jgi:hypothetical protein
VKFLIPIGLREDGRRMLLECPETKRWREELVWLDGNIAYRKILSRTNVAKMKITGKYLFKGKVAPVTGREGP